MTRRHGILALSLTVLFGLAPTAGQASVLTLEAGSLSFTFSFLPSVAVDQGAAIPIFVSSSGGSFVLPASAFAGTDVSVSIFTNELINTLNVTVTNSTGSFSVGGGPAGGFGGSAALNGQLVLGILGGLINLEIPISPVGGGGFVRVTPQATLFVSVTGHAWTTGIASVTGLDFTTRPTPLASPNWINTVTALGADNRTGGHKGALTLVTPFRVSSNGFGVNPVFATLALTFVPEPGTLLFFLSAAAVTLWAGWLSRRG